jgi:hypothetical protein
VFVGHSGAGPLLPQIAARIAGGPLIFVDADIPPVHGAAELMPADILGHLRSIAVDEMLPPWSEWLGPAVMHELLPDVERPSQPRSRPPSPRSPHPPLADETVSVSQ